MEGQERYEEGREESLLGDVKQSGGELCQR